MGSSSIPVSTSSTSNCDTEKIPKMSSDSCDNLCYGPLVTFEELMKYGEDGGGGGITEICRSKTVPLWTKNFGSGKINLNGKCVGSREGKHPLTLVCHDLKGGYGDDRFVDGTANPENYAFRHWLLTDIFVYFSHKFVTIPTLGWINAAHSHGVKILGTIITEWDDGAELCSKILASEESIDKTVQKLCKINEDYGFDGYLLNIENKLKEGQVQGMSEFARKLTKALKEKSPNNLVIWYDSVTKEGELKWQNCLNEENKNFFDVCDGIFLNYNWTDENLLNSVVLAGDRKYDVFVGVDCWGRGCWGGGGTNTNLAIDKISKHDLSYAIFAPGWTYESHDFVKYPVMDDELWTKCVPNLHFRYLVDQLIPNPNQKVILSSDSLAHAESVESSCDNSSGQNVNDKKLDIYFVTDFSRGYGRKKFSLGNVISESPWLDLSKQSFQPVIFSSLKCIEYDCTKAQIAFEEAMNKEMQKPKSERKIVQPSSTLIHEERKIVYDTGEGFYGGGALKILNSKQRKDFQNPITFSPLWIPLNIPINSSRLTLAVILAWKSVSINHQPQVFLELGKENLPNRKIRLGSLDTLATSVRGKYSISLRLGQFLQCLPGVQLKESDDMEFQFQKNNYDEKELNGWGVSCYLFDIDQAYDEYSTMKSLRIGAEGDISLGFLSLGQITHYR